jgi:hypothetical protein
MIAANEARLFAKKAKKFLKKQFLSVIFSISVKCRYDVNCICCVGKWVFYK